MNNSSATDLFGNAMRLLYPGKKVERENMLHFIADDATYVVEAKKIIDVV